MGGRHTQYPFGKLLRELRLEAKLSQEELAERSRVSKDAVSALERGARRAPHRVTLSLLAAGLRLNDIQKRTFESVAKASRNAGSPRGTHPEVKSSQDACWHNLAASTDSFHGRDLELGKLQQIITTRRMVTLVGSGGVGKTRLAIEYGWRELELNRFRDGIWFVDLSSALTGDDALIRIADTLLIRESLGTTLCAMISNGLTHKHTLLILDNCEHVLDRIQPLLGEIIRGCPLVRIIATSRQLIDVPSEITFQVDPLPTCSVPADAELAWESLLASPAERLFLERAQDAAPSLMSKAGPADASTIATICRQLDGLPLALELAAARTRDLSLTDIESGLNNRLSLLSKPKRAAKDRHLELRATLDWSYRLLSATEKTLFERLGVFCSNFCMESAVAVCADPRGVVSAICDRLTGDDVRIGIQNLIAKSLVSMSVDQSGRAKYRLLETTRDYACFLLHEHNQYEAIMRRHCSRYLCLARNAIREKDNRLWDPYDSKSLDILIYEISEVQSSLDWAIRNKHAIGPGVELTALMAGIWARSGNDLGAVETLSAAKLALEALVNGDDTGRIDVHDAQIPLLEIKELDPPSLSSMSVAHLGALFPVRRAHHAGEVLFHKGDFATELYYIVSGTVILQEIDQTVGPGELLGELALFRSSNARTATAICGASTVLLGMPVETVRNVYASNSAFRLFVIETLGHRLLRDLTRWRQG